MSMFCFQCQEACKNSGCTVAGMCGKKADTANLQDELIFNLKKLSAVIGDNLDEKIGDFVCKALFVTITNANFSNKSIQAYIDQAVKLTKKFNSNEKAISIKPGVLATENEDVRSLRELVTYGLKGIAAYVHHASNLGYRDLEVYRFIVDALAKLTADLNADELVALTLKQENTL